MSYYEDYDDDYDYDDYDHHEPDWEFYESYYSEGGYNHGSEGRSETSG